MNFRSGTRRNIILAFIVLALAAVAIIAFVGKPVDSLTETGENISPAYAELPTETPDPEPTPALISNAPAEVINVSVSEPTEPEYKYVILLDPGHGKDDYGTPVGGVHEKTIVLLIAEKVYERFKDDSDYKIYMTRYDDTYPTLDERIAMAEEYDVNFMISIHANSYKEDTRVNGTETYYSEEAQSIAATIHNSLMSKIGARDRGRKDASGLYILKNALRPTILIETGFMTNPDELEKLISDEYQEKIAEGIYEGIKKECE